MLSPFRFQHLQQVTNWNLLGPNNPPKETCWKVLVFTCCWKATFQASQLSWQNLRDAYSRLCLFAAFSEMAEVQCTIGWVPDRDSMGSSHLIHSLMRYDSLDICAWIHVFVSLSGVGIKEVAEHVSGSCWASFNMFLFKSTSQRVNPFTSESKIATSHHKPMETPTAHTASPFLR